MFLHLLSTAESIVQMAYASVFPQPSFCKDLQDFLESCFVLQYNSSLIPLLPIFRNFTSNKWANNSPIPSSGAYNKNNLTLLHLVQLFQTKASGNLFHQSSLRLYQISARDTWDYRDSPVPLMPVHRSFGHINWDRLISVFCKVIFYIYISIV